MIISRISILLSLLGFFIGVSIQHHLFQGYQTVTGKTQALYGIYHVANIKYAFIGITALFLSIISIFKKEKLKTILFTLSLSVISILVVVLELWKLFL